MQQNNSAFPLMISVVVMDPNQLRSVYALLGGAAIAVAQSAPQGNAIGSTTVAAPTPAVEQPASGAEASPAAVTTGGDNAPADNGEVDAHGHPWSADLHASTKTQTKEGLWRMKPGVTRPDPLPGFPVDTGTGTSSETQAPSATSPAATAPENAPPATAPEAPAEDDEFAAFRAAAATSEATDAAAAASVPARQYSDADLGALCNQAAVKLGDPEPVKQIIARFTPEGVVAHSRNIPEESRTEFVKEVEAKAGIEFAG